MKRGVRGPLPSTSSTARLCDLLKDNRLGVETVESVRIHEDWFKSI